MLVAVPAGKLEAGAAVTAWWRMRREGAQGEGGGLGSWAQCAGPTENQGLLVARRAGAAAGTLECSPFWSLLGDSSNPLTRDSEAMSTPLILDPFAHTSPLLMPRIKGPAREELITIVMLLVLGKESQEAFSASRSL